MTTPERGAPGIGVDSRGGAVIDPSVNVNALVEASIQRLDDLRQADQQLSRETLAHIRDMAALRAEYDDKLREAESKRIDAIRAVDQGNVTRASEVAAAQATALASQLQVSAEALRAQVEATRITTADTLAAALQPIQNDVAVLREVQFRQQGEKAGTSETVSSRRASMGQLLAFVGATSTIIGATVVALAKLH